eukprot:CAMPEP_0201574028 /NCGR_PEP_ID=MMETSP0190_2-20130828/18219_1 /ASSEMBLY_ACC=CAM_ASM_000263 /TAXON_ID=37353 /ORGANISM="Rosalina sp." /LENGTH=375 /DNA_ID=CAMNT_0048001689 /DNA_START=317 /DNA_END=1444 /DNA_ORIENTATION=+
MTQSSMNVPSLPNLSPQSSNYSGHGHLRGYPHIMDGNQSDATTLTTKSGRLYTNSRHLRHDSHMTQRTAYSEGDAKSQLDDIHEKSPTPPLPDESLPESWQKWITHLEQKNRDLSTLFLRSDNAVNKFKKTMVPLHERINQLETQNQTRKKTIDKLNKRIERRNDTIAKLKKQIPDIDMSRGTPNFMPLSLKNQLSMNSNDGHMPATGSVHSNMSSNKALHITPAMEHLLNQQQTKFEKQHYSQIHQNPNQYQVRYQQYHPHTQTSTQRGHGHGHMSNNTHQYSSSSQLLSQKKKKRKKSKHKNRMILANDDGHKVRMNGYMSGGSNGSIQSAPANNQNSSNNNGNTPGGDGGILGSITSMAYGYIMGGSTPGGY